MAVPDTVTPAAGELMDTVGAVVSGGVLATVTDIGAELAVLPAASAANASSVWVPLGKVVVSNANEYGAAVSLAK